MSKPIPKEYSTALEDRRVALGISVSALAKKAGVSRNTVYKILRGIGDVKILLLFKVCRVLGMQIVLTIE